MVAHSTCAKSGGALPNVPNLGQKIGFFCPIQPEIQSNWQNEGTRVLCAVPSVANGTMDGGLLQHRKVNEPVGVNKEENGGKGGEMGETRGKLCPACLARQRSLLGRRTWGNMHRMW